MLFLLNIQIISLFTQRRVKIHGPVNDLYNADLNMPCQSIARFAVAKNLNLLKTHYE